MSIDNRDYMIERYLKREGIRPYRRKERTIKKIVICIWIAVACIWTYIYRHYVT